MLRQWCLSLCFVASGAAAQPPDVPVFRVCSDPNNLPFSNQRGEGFENKLAELLAAELGARVEYTWWAQRRGFIRNTLKAKQCDVVMGVPSGYELTLTTAPYYRSSYVFVTRRDRKLSLRSLDDPRLRSVKVGVHLIGDDYANAPPAHALAKRGIINNVVGYSVYGDYRMESPPARLVEAVDKGEIDVAVAWGPLAGFFAQRSSHPLVLRRVTPARDGSLPFVFDVSMGVRRGDQALKDRLEQALSARKPQVRRLLQHYGVPLL